MIKKILIGIVSVLVIAGFIGWEAAVAIHDRESPVSQHGSLNTLLEMVSHFADTGKRAQSAYDKGDFQTARKLWQGLADRGSSDTARVNLGVLYLKGQGVPADAVEAQKWFILAGDPGKKNRAILERNLTPYENAQAQKRALEWKPGR